MTLGELWAADHVACIAEVLVEAKETLQEYMDRHLKEQEGKQPREFKPCVIFNKVGNSFECYWKNGSFYAEDDGELTIFRDHDTKEIVGVQFHGVLQRMGLIETAGPNVERRSPT